MTLQIGLLFAILVVMVYLFLTEKLAVDLTAFLGLIVLIFVGYVTPAEAFQGFSSPAVITMLSVFIVGAAMLETGVADMIGGQIHRLVGNSEIRLIVTLMVVAGVLSAFMNNIAATAVLMPAVATLGPRAGLAPSRLFMPLAFGAILGGTTTLVGTPPNILAAQMLADRGIEPFKLFDFTLLGGAIMLLGLVFMTTIGVRLLPSKDTRGTVDRQSEDLAQVYRLEDRLFSLELPEDSPLDGKTVAETRLGTTLGIKLVSLQRGTQQIQVVGDTVLRAGDVLLVDGEAEHVRELLSIQQVDVQPVDPDQLPDVPRGVGGIRAVVKSEATVVGRSLRELAFRDRFGVAVAGIRRADDLVTDHLAELTLLEGDEILGLGVRESLERFSKGSDFEVLEFGLAALRDLQDRVYTITIPHDSDLVGKTIAESRLGELVGVTVVGITRDAATQLTVSPTDIIGAEHQLLIAGEPQSMQALVAMGQVAFRERRDGAALEDDDVGMVEVALAPRSSAEGRTLKEMDFRDRYGLIAFALWRGGEPIHTDLADVPLRFGDALLLRGPMEKLDRLAADSDFVVLTQTTADTKRKRKAPFALAGLGLMIALVVTGYQPIHVAAFTAASLVVLAGALTMTEAYRAIEWRAIFLVAAVLPVGFAMERTGAANFLADSVSQFAGPLGPYFVLGSLVVLASLLSQGLDGAPSVVLLAPVVIEMADRMDLSPYPLMMGVSLAASAAFMTPFSHKCNLLVMGAGGYRSKDYLKVGTPLTLLLFVLLIWLIPLVFPF